MQRQGERAQRVSVRGQRHGQRGSVTVDADDAALCAYNQAVGAGNEAIGAAEAPGYAAGIAPGRDNAAEGAARDPHTRLHLYLDPSLETMATNSFRISSFSTMRKIG